jgi:hypothetical protein
MADSGYTYNAWKGENLAAGSDTPQLTFQLWRDSPGHNANMLNPDFVVVGLAKAYGSDSSYGWYWAAEFGGYDEAGSPPPSPPEPTLTPEPPPPSPPTPTQTPEPSPTSPPEPTQTPEPSPTSPPEPTLTPELPPPSPPEPTLTPEPPPGADLGLAPPTGDSEPAPDTFGPAPTVRELVAGWNQVQCPTGSMQLSEVLPVDSGKLRAIYAWDASKGSWRRYLPGIDIPGLNTLTELTDQQTIWILASERFLLTLPA